MSSRLVVRGRSVAGQPGDDPNAARGGLVSYLINGLTSASTLLLASGLSNAPSGVTGLDVSRAMVAAWRASIWTMLPAAASSFVLVRRPAPL